MNILFTLIAIFYFVISFYTLTVLEWKKFTKSDSLRLYLLISSTAAALAYLLTRFTLLLVYSIL